MMIVSAANVYYNNYVSRVHWMRAAIISALVACTRSLTLYAVIFCPGLQSFFVWEEIAMMKGRCRDYMS